MSGVEELERKRAALKDELSKVEKELLAAKKRAAISQQSVQRKLDVLPPDHPSFWKQRGSL